MSRLTSLAMGTLVGVLILNCHSSLFAQPGAPGGAPARVSVVAGTVAETVPVAQKKYVGNVEAIELCTGGSEDGTRIQKQMRTVHNQLI